MLWEDNYMKVLICDPVSEDCKQALAAAGIQYDVKTDMTPAQLQATAPGYQAIVVRSATKVTAEVIDAAVDLKLIVRGGVGVDNIDVGRAKAKSIEVKNTPAANSASVAELAIGFMFALARPIVRGTVGLRAGKWEKKTLKGSELAGKTLGLLGVGRIGRITAEKALALGMKVIAYDPYVDAVPGLAVTLKPLAKVLAEADYLSLHLPLSDETRHLIGKPQFAQMKDGAYVINCARGGTIDEAALCEALESGKVAGAALDVFETEPVTQNKLLELDNVIATPHIGAATKEAQDRVGGEVAQILIDYRDAHQK
jgi:D-3-phosphoglycerate dehydrogenase